MRHLIVLLALVFSVTSQASTEFGKIHELEGRAYISDASENHVALHVGEEIYVGQTINTEEGAELHITSTDGGLIALRPNTVFRVDEYIAEESPEDKVHMSLIKGSLRSITGWIPRYNPESYKVSVLTATIGVRGTDHEITIIEGGEEAGIHNAVYEGATVLRNPTGEVHVPAGHFAFAPHHGATTPVLLDTKPKFHARKLLYKMEHKFEQRKIDFENRMEQLHEEWRQKVKLMHSGLKNLEKEISLE
jgi:FecR-like protein